MSQYRRALVVGRFQPFHFGHLHLIEAALAVADTVVVAIGSANVQNADNPYTFEQRRDMVQAVVQAQGWKHRIAAVVPSPDCAGDAEWLHILEKNAGPFDVAMGNNDWTNRVLEEGGHVVMRVPHWQRDLYEGSKIRSLMRDGKSWQERVPTSVRSWC